ncbi:MAG: putative O-glycosylation ligase, exosortase A system-associated [Pseudomonadota bacterium]
MSGLILSIFLILALAIAVAQPYVGVLLYVWMSVFYPHRWVYGGLELSWSMIAAIIAGLGFLNRREPPVFNRSTITVLLLLFFFWTTITSILAIFQDVAWQRWADFGKVLITFFIVSALTVNRFRLNALIWAIIAGAGAVATKGFLQTALTGGASQVVGIPGSSFIDNNDIARLFGLCFPFMLFMAFHGGTKWLRWASLSLAFAAIVAIIGTQSRGAFAALAVTMLYWFFISRRKLAMAATALSIASLIGLLLVGPFRDAWVERMETIEDYETDGSFQGRVFAWNFAISIAERSPITGDGFGAFRGAITDQGRWKDAHSIYFETLGEHGVVGLVLLLSLFGFGFLRARKITKVAGKDPKLYFERDLSIATQFSLIFFLIAGLVGSETYHELSYLILALIAVLDHNLIKRPQLLARWLGDAAMASRGEEEALADGRALGGMPAARAARR